MQTVKYMSEIHNKPWSTQEYDTKFLFGRTQSNYATLNSKQQRLSRFQNLKSAVGIEPNFSMSVSDPRPIFSPSYVFTVSGDLFPFFDFSGLTVSESDRADRLRPRSRTTQGVALGWGL
jgi:hypothetical protein